MKNFIFLVLFSFGIQSAYAVDEQSSGTLKTKMLSPDELVQVQLEAYNNRDIEAFLSTFSSDIKFYNFPDQLTSSGKEKMRADFTRFFANNPNLHLKVKKKIVKGNVVILHEVVSGLSGGNVLDVVAIYEINKENKIKTLSFVW